MQYQQHLNYWSARLWNRDSVYSDKWKFWLTNMSIYSPSRSTSGSKIRAEAKSNRACCPPEKVPTNRSNEILLVAVWSWTASKALDILDSRPLLLFCNWAKKKSRIDKLLIRNKIWEVSGIYLLANTLLPVLWWHNLKSGWHNKFWRHWYYSGWWMQSRVHQLYYSAFAGSILAHYCYFIPFSNIKACIG